jgi:hypothetical protein
LIAARQDDDGRRLREAAELCEQIEATAIGKHQIEDHQIDVAGAPFGFGQRSGDVHAVAFTSQRIGQRLGDGRLVFDHQHVDHNGSLPR